MRTSNDKRGDILGTKLESLGNWFTKHAKIVMPIILVLCVAITVVIAVNAKKGDAEKPEDVEANSTLDETVNSTPAVPQVPLQENTDPKIDELINAYYTAMAEGNADAMRDLVDVLDDMEVIRIQESGKYIDSYPTIDIYTKTGPKDNTVLVYVCSEVKFTDMEQLVPGMRGFYIRIDEDGKYRIIDENAILDKEEENYMKQVALQDDVVVLNNKITANYNDLVTSDVELAEFIYDMTEEVKASVGRILAEAEENGESAEGTEEGAAELQPEETDSTETAAVVTRVRATDVVNIRSSDSETADKLGKAAIGDEFKLLEKIGNGWSKIEYEGAEAYIKSEFLEDIETTETAEAAGDGNEQSQEPTVTGTVTVKENVRIRSAASETSEKLGVAYAGSKLELVMKRADGWTEIKYEGKTAYVKSEFVE